ncbi:MAG: tetratricopeptide repeat protein [Rhizonema sp. PD38]|nr:tetratricopeptide repeat protein [Rhizonema sp. PD38]
MPSLLRDVLAPGTLLRGGDYRIDYALGRGGFGITYRAAHTSLEKLVAIKEFYPQAQAHREGTTGRLTVPIPQEESYQRGLQRFEREGRTLARLNHPNVVSVVDFFKERGTAYLVMELLSGNTLKDELDSQLGKILPVERVKTVMTALVNALTVVHQQGIYHLDLKPDNLMVTPEGRIVLVDFGASRQNLGSRTSTHQNTRSYTEAYAAPELISSAEVGAASDLFELGMMLCEMLTGKLPPTALSRLFNDNWIPQDLDEPWQSMVTDALQMKPENRPETVLSWWEIVLRFEEEQRQQKAESQRQEALKNNAQGLDKINKGDFRGAIEDFNQVIRLNPNDTDAYCNRGVAHYELGDKKAAIEDFNQAICLNPNFADAYHNRGLSHYELGDKKAAIEDFNQAICLNPNFADAYHNRGLSHYELGDKKAAIEDLNQAIRLNPKFVNAYCNRGNARYELGNKKAAIEDFNQAIRLNPDFANAYHKRGIAHSNLGDKKAAIEDYNQAIHLNPNFANAYYNRGIVQSNLGDKKAAIEDYNQAIHLNPNFANAYNNRGVARDNLGDKKAAIEDYNQAIRLNPNHANAYHNRGVARDNLGDKQGANADFEKVAQLNQQQGNKDRDQNALERLLKLLHLRA